MRDNVNNTKDNPGGNIVHQGLRETP